jgi:hypothetical protein
VQPVAAELDLDRIGPPSLVRRDVVRRDEPATLLHQGEELSTDRPLVGATRPVFRERLQSRHEPGLAKKVALVEE